MPNAFALGDIVATRQAVALCAASGIDPVSLIARHAAGDWGDLDAEDRWANERALKSGDRLLSAYMVAGEKFYVITEWDRSVTTLLLASEY